jgi:hypothetical protein
MRNLSSALPFVVARKQNPMLPDREQVVRAIYNAYPRHVAKRDALKAFDRALYRLEFEEKNDIPPEFWQISSNVTIADFLLDRVRIFASSPAGKKGTYTPHPATWANQSRYLDDVSDWFNPEEGNGHAKLETFAERDAAGTREAIERVRQDRLRIANHVNSLGPSSERGQGSAMAQRSLPLPRSGD